MKLFVSKILDLYESLRSINLLVILRSRKDSHTSIPFTPPSGCHISHSRIFPSGLEACMFTRILVAMAFASEGISSLSIGQRALEGSQYED